MVWNRAPKPEKVLSVMDAVATYGEDYNFRTIGQPEPTTAIPGSSDKIEVMIARIENGEELWHADDQLTYDGLPPERH